MGNFNPLGKIVDLWGHKKIFAIYSKLEIVGVGETLGSIGMSLSFVSDHLFYFINLSSSLLETVRELRTEGKRQGYLV